MRLQEILSGKLPLDLTIRVRSPLTPGQVVEMLRFSFFYWGEKLCNGILYSDFELQTRRNYI